MKIGNIDVKISALALAVFTIFTILLIFTYFITKDSSLLVWGIPTLIFLFIIPPALNYLSQSSYADLVPEYEKKAKNVRIKAINLGMVGQAVRIQGIVERTYFRFLNRPQYLIADKSGEISVKMFTSPQEDVKINDIVEVLGMVIKRYIVTGDAVVNCISIKKISIKGNNKKE